MLREIKKNGLGLRVEGLGLRNLGYSGLGIRDLGIRAYKLGLVL